MNNNQFPVHQHLTPRGMATIRPRRAMRGDLQDRNPQHYNCLDKAWVELRETENIAPRGWSGGKRG